MTTTPIDFAALFMLGFLGTGHCIGMCGPLIVALPGQHPRMTAHVAYHAGRLITYGMLGAVMGAIGSGLIRLAGVVGADATVWVARIQVGISVLAGLFLLMFGLSSLGFGMGPRWLVVALPDRMPGWRRFISRPPNQRSGRDLFLMGLVLGALPCGLSYAVFAKALSSAHMVTGAVSAFVFGLGTLPGLLAVGAGAAMLVNRFRRPAQLLAGLIMLGMAAMLLVKAWETAGI